jgi:predicted GNAT family acetyltransferase
MLRALRTALAAGGGAGPWLAIDDVARERAWADAFTVVSRAEELHYLLPRTKALPLLEESGVEVVPPEGVDRLDAFLRAHGATAWARGSFRTGPYVWVRRGEEIVAAAGVHFVTPVVGQIANVLVAPDARRKGLGRAVTVAIARRLRAEGRVVSLFVRSENAAAVNLYETLGFVRVRTLAAMDLR